MTAPSVKIDDMEPPPTSWPWGYLAALPLPRGGFDVVAVYHDGPAGAYKVRRFRRQQRNYAAGIGHVAVDAICTLEVARAHLAAESRSADWIALAIERAQFQLCIACGARCYERKESQPPMRCASGRCQRCEPRAS